MNRVQELQSDFSKTPESHAAYFVLRLAEMCSDANLYPRDFVDWYVDWMMMDRNTRHEAIKRALENAIPPDETNELLWAIKTLTEVT